MILEHTDKDPIDKIHLGNFYTSSIRLIPWLSVVGKKNTNELLEQVVVVLNDLPRRKIGKLLSLKVT